MEVTFKSLMALVGMAVLALLALIHFPILGIAAFLALGALIGSGVKWGRDRKPTLIMSEHLSAESRLMLRPVRRLAAFNRELARKYRHDVEQTAEAMDQTDAVVRQCIRWLQVRDRLVELQIAQEEARITLADVHERLEDAESEEERTNLLAALPELEALVARHDWVQQQLDLIAGRVMLAQFSLEHLKTMLTVSAMKALPADDGPPALGMSGSGIALGG